ncbi:MOSC domain-containing protein [Tomitella cavernea]|uniref:MOSC domain-containing protein n=1 Tax=Tomitella cavernea TaxID=1387982 RepID=A0ABP9CT46_9ACTN|nr:MOSC domain-containing protein [Tomitella cavernea]
MGSAAEHMRISELWRYPVKSLGGEPLTRALVDGDGLAGDHQWAIVDESTGTVASAKRTRVWGSLLQCSARMDPDAADPADAAALRITTPDGVESAGDDPSTIARLSALCGRPLRLQFAAAADADGMAMEMEWAPETHEGMEEAIAHSSARAEQDAGSAVPVGAVPTGGGRGRYYDLAPVHIVTTSSVRRLVDDDTPIRAAMRRFRPNIVVGGDDWDDGYVEDAWLAGPLDAGAVGLAPSIPVGRCVMVTLQHGTVARDRTMLRRIATRHRLDVGYGTAPAPALGIYADVLRPATVSVGDAVRVGGERAAAARH